MKWKTLFLQALVLFGAAGVADAQGSDNQCVYLDGDGDGVFVPPHASLDQWDEYTMELWVQHDAGPMWLLRAGDPYRQSFLLKGDQGDVYVHHNWWHNNNAGTTCGGNDEAPGPSWTHIAATFADQEIKLYQDGVLQYSCGGMQTPYAGLGYPVRIGHDYPYWTDNFLQGRIDEVRIWDRARSEGEIRSTINLRIGSADVPNHPGLVSCLGFEGDTQDSTGVNHAELVGDTHFVDASDIPVLFDCNENGIPDEEEIASDPGADCDGNGALDSCEIAAGIGDCNLDGVLDVCEVAADPGKDCDEDGVLDACQGAPDCNGNGVPDLCDIFNRTSQDCNVNGIPDECDLLGEYADCNNNGIPDECDLCEMCWLDCNGNGIPDECDLEFGDHQDCNSNGLLDVCDVEDEWSMDCNDNGVPDECEYADGTLTDLNNNGVADQCECPVISYCTTSPNSVGEGVVLSTEGSACPDLNNMTLVAEGGPTGQPGLMFYGSMTANQPFGMGVRCVGGSIYRLNTLFFGGAGRAVMELDLTRGPMGSGPGEITPGSTWHFQMWYRDPASGSWGYNLSNGLAATFGS